MTLDPQVFPSSSKTVTTIEPSKNVPRVNRTIIYKSKTPASEEQTETIVKPGGETDPTYQTMKYFFTISGLGKDVKLSTLLCGCTTSKEKCDKIMNLLRVKGMEGKPTYSRCIELKKRLQAKREARDLDRNLIISPNTRSTRRTLHQPVKDSESITVPPPIITKLKTIIDSDSEWCVCRLYHLIFTLYKIVLINLSYRENNLKHIFSPKPLESSENFLIVNTFCL